MELLAPPDPETLRAMGFSVKSVGESLNDVFEEDTNIEDDVPF